MIIGGVNQGQQAAQGIAAQVAEINKNAAAQAEQPNGNAVTDIVELSLEAKQKARDEMKNSQTDIEMLLQQLENAKAQGEAMGSMMDERIKCLRIAMNIMAGDEVPNEDIRYLAEKDPEMLARSMSMRRQKDDARDCERVSEDEEDASGEASEAPERKIGSSSGSSGGGSAPAEASAPSAPSAPEGGGESSSE